MKRLFTNELFEQVKTKDEAFQKMNDSRNAFIELYKKIEPLIGNGRLAAITRTKLEEACMFSKKAICFENKIN